MGQSQSRVIFFHKGFADEKSVEPGSSQLFDRERVADAAL